MPDLDIATVLSPKPFTALNSAFVTGATSPDALAVDTGYFILSHAIDTLSDKCVISPSDIALIASQESSMLAAAMVLYQRGHPLRAAAMMRSLVPTFLEKAGGYVEKLPISCAHSLSKHLKRKVIEKAAKVAEIVVDYVLWMGKWYLDYFRTGQRAIGIAFSYQPVR
jgi:hypothetical protein